jgi:hypothetical protein
MSEKLESRLYMSDVERLGDAAAMAEAIVSDLPELRPSQVAYAVQNCAPGVDSDAARVATYGVFKSLENSSN